MSQLQSVRPAQREKARGMLADGPTPEGSNTLSCGSGHKASDIECATQCSRVQQAHTHRCPAPVETCANPRVRALLLCVKEFNNIIFYFGVPAARACTVLGEAAELDFRWVTGWEAARQKSSTRESVGLSLHPSPWHHFNPLRDSAVRAAPILPPEVHHQIHEASKSITASYTFCARDKEKEREGG